MILLLDTHAFLWFIQDDPRLSEKSRTLIEEGTNELLVSVASLWEIAIKVRIDKLQVGVPFGRFMSSQIELNRAELLGIDISHTAVIATLPLHHRDPFDRMIIAQAIVEQVPIVSADTTFDAYSGVTRLW